MLLGVPLPLTNIWYMAEKVPYHLRAFGGLAIEIMLARFLN